MQNLYTMGYLHGSSKRTLTGLIATRTPLVDIRKSPNSKRVEWTRDMLKQEPGLLYYWLPNLGNENYALRGMAPIEIHDMDRGLIELEHILSLYGRACLMCACAYPGSCHRQVVASEAARRFGLSVVHLPASRKAGRGDGAYTWPCFCRSSSCITFV